MALRLTPAQWQAAIDAAGDTPRAEQLRRLAGLEPPTLPAVVRAPEPEAPTRLVPGEFSPRRWNRLLGK